MESPDLTTVFLKRNPKAQNMNPASAQKYPIAVDYLLRINLNASRCGCERVSSHHQSPTVSASRKGEKRFHPVVPEYP